MNDQEPKKIEEEELQVTDEELQLEDPDVMPEVKPIDWVLYFETPWGWAILLVVLIILAWVGGW